MPTRHLRTLYRIFLRRLVDLDLLATNADPTRLVTQFTTVFAGTSFLFALPALLIGAHGPGRPGAWTPEHFFLALTLTAAGILTVLNWDAAFPDKRDLLVLAPLPVRPGTLFLAKIAAFFAAPALAVVGLNVFTGIAWPPAFASGHGGVLGFLRVWPAWLFTVCVTGVFIVCAVLTLYGLAANLLPRQLFLRLAPVLQAVTLCLFLCLFFLEPSLESPAALTDPANQRLLALLPSYWFLGLFEQLNGSIDPALIPLAHRAWHAVPLSIAAAAATLLLAYVRLLPRVVEQPDLVPTRSRRPAPSRTLAGAVTVFGLRTLARSRQHRTLLSIVAGFGLAIVVGFSRLSPEPAALAAPTLPASAIIASTLFLTLSVLGLRLLTAIPVTLPANWIMRLTELRPPRLYRRAIRIFWLTTAVAPVWLATAAWFLAKYPLRPAAAHLAALLLFGIILVELALANLRKLPFTCAWLPGKANLHLVLCIGFVILLQPVIAAATLESRWLTQPRSTAALLVSLAATALAAHRRTEAATPSTEPTTLLFDDEPLPDLVSLNLS